MILVDWIMCYGGDCCVECCNCIGFDCILDSVCYIERGFDVIGYCDIVCEYLVYYFIFLQLKNILMMCMIYLLLGGFLCMLLLVKLRFEKFVVLKILWICWLSLLF